MKGEELAWHKLASHLHMALDECKAKHTSRQFLRWIEYLEKEWNEHTKFDHQMARLTCEVVRNRVSKPGRVKPKHFFLKFDLDGTESEDDDLSEEELQQLKERRMRASKAAWGGFLSRQATGTGQKRKLPPNVAAKSSSHKPKNRPRIKPR